MNPLKWWKKRKENKIRLLEEIILAYQALVEKLRIDNYTLQRENELLHAEIKVLKNKLEEVEKGNE